MRQRRPARHPRPRRGGRSGPRPATARDLWIASLVVCGLLVMEDPGVLAARVWLTDAGMAGWVADTGLAVLMLAYNYVASRFVVGVAGSREIADAMDLVDAHRAARVATTGHPLLRLVRRTAVMLNPFHLVKQIGEFVGRGADRLGGRLHDTPLRRLACWIEDLGMVNLLGVPGASLAVASGGRTVSRARSVRHCVLFVGSWFTGARVVGALVGAAHQLPGVGPVATTVTGTIGTVFATLTDPRGPIGAAAVVLVTVSVVRYAHEVRRAMPAANPDPGHAPARHAWPAPSTPAGELRS